MPLILGVHALRSYLKIICEYELHNLQNKKVSGAKDHGKNHVKARQLLVRHLLRNGLLSCIGAFISVAFWARLSQTMDHF